MGDLGESPYNPAHFLFQMNINPSLVLVQPRKTRPFITERLSMGRKESNQTNKQFHMREKLKCIDYVEEFKKFRPKLLPKSS